MRDPEGVLLVSVICSDPDCAVEAELVVDELEAVEVELCADCDCVVTVLAVAAWEPAARAVAA